MNVHRIPVHWDFKNKNMTKLFYRIGTDTNEGLWYDKNGNFTGLIHSKFDFCTNSKLEMPFDPEIVGYISVADSLEHLYQWFTKQDILKLQEHGFSILEYKSFEWKFYQPFQHNVINQHTSILTNKLILV